MQRAVRGQRSSMAAACLAAALACAWPAAPAFAQPMGLPSMGAASSTELSPAIERILGEAIMDQGRHDPTYIADLDINQYLTGLGRRLAAHAPQPVGQPITVFAVRDPSINAFTLPGGFIGVNSGLVQAAQSESELAGVLAHEIGHVMQRHIARGIAQQSQSRGIMMASLVGALLAALAGQGDLAMGAASFGQAAAIDRQLGFSRAAEQEADRVGLQMMRQAGFDPRGMLSMFRRLMNASSLNESHGGDYAATHPLSIQRLSDLENRLEEQTPHAVASNPEFWFVRARLALIQARSGSDASSLQGALNDTARTQKGARQAAALYALGWLDQQSGHLDQARARLAAAQAQARAPQLAELAIRLAADQGADAALQAAASAWQQWPRSQGVALQRAQALRAAGKDGQAVDFLRTVIKQWPDIPAYQKLLAESLDRQGRRVDAHEAMARYFELTGALPTAVEHLQAARRETKDFYTQSKLDAQIQNLHEQLATRRELLKPYKKD